MLLDTDYETSGAIHSNGEYIYVNSIPTGSGWHGPSFMRTLPSYFKVEDLGSFSANLSLVHGNNGYRMSTTSVSLFDENKRIVASLMITDAWGYSGPNAQKQYFTATYYFEDGSYRSYSSADYAGDTSGVVTIRYDPLAGVFGDVPGRNEQFLFLHNQVNLNRIIKYIAVQSYRYGSDVEHDERIYSIRLSYAGSEYTVFHDPCNDMNDFHMDPDFPFGTRSNPPEDDQFVVDPGQSYMRPDIPTTSPYGWHGPCYTHALEKPFRLYQLSRFDGFQVVGQMIQQSSKNMGKTYVALFDENKKITLLAYWGDSWAGTKRGYYRTVYYPESGGSYSQVPHPDYTSSSFLFTAKMATLMDMRIHDINVIADLTALNPDSPIKYDGTGDGAGPEPEDEVNPPSQQFADQNLVFQWLQSWWPTLQITVTAAFSVCTLVIDLTIDILGAMNVVTSNFGIQGINFDDPVVAQRVAQQVEQAQIDTSESGSHLTLATLAVIVSSWLVINWASYLVFMVCLGVWSACMFKHLWALYHNYANGYTTVGDTLMGIGLIMAVWLVKLLGFLIIHGELAERVKGILTSIFGKVNAVAMQAAKWTLRIAAVLWLLVMVYEIGAIASTQPMNAIFVAPSWVT
jgi:hypothetical protein